MNDTTNTFINDGRMLFIVNSDYIIIYQTHDILILDNKSYTIIKHIHSEEPKMIIDFSLDKDNLYYVQYTFRDLRNDKFELIKYNIKQDTQITVFEKSGELVSNILAIDDKIIFLHEVDNILGIRYMDMRSGENRFFTVEDNMFDMNDNIFDILFDGQRIIYETEDQAFYSVCIFTGETKKIGIKSDPLSEAASA